MGKKEDLLERNSIAQFIDLFESQGETIFCSENTVLKIPGISFLSGILLFFDACMGFYTCILSTIKCFHGCFLEGSVFPQILILSGQCWKLGCTLNM